MKFYGTDLCPDCVEALQELKDRDIAYEFVGITESIEALKEFLQLRDSRVEFEPIKKEGNVGIPCFLDEDGTIHFEI